LVTGGSGTGAKFFGSKAQTARLMLYGLLAVVLMAMDHRGNYVSRVRAAAGYAVEPVYHLVAWPVGALRNLFGQFQSRRALREENGLLEQRLLAQQGALQRLATLEEENRRLRTLFRGAESQPYEYRFAELVGVALDPFSHQVLIDRGSRDGVTVGQAVIDGSGVMGQVEQVQLHFSSVRLISDPSHALPVQVNRSGLRAIAFGMGETDRLSLPNVPREADVREGDLIVTSGLGHRFPGGYPVAVVTVIDREEGQTFAHVEAAPLAALDRGREVLLIRVPEQPEAGPGPGPGGEEEGGAGEQPAAEDVEQPTGEAAAEGQGGAGEGAADVAEAPPPADDRESGEEGE
jgi:rod shape-determining protein MreC